MTTERPARWSIAVIGLAVVVVVVVAVGIGWRRGTETGGAPRASATVRSTATTPPSTAGTASTATPSTSSTAAPAASTSAAPAPPTTAPTSSTTATATAPAGPTAPGASLEGRTIVVDPGHNGRNDEHPDEVNRPVDAGGFTKPCNSTGTAVGALSESEVNWDIAVRLRARLEAQGAVVVMTRPDDDGWGPCVDERGRSANGADLMVSVHADGAAVAGRGFHVIASPTSARSRDLAVHIRNAMQAAGFLPSTYVGEAGLDLRSDLGTLNLASVPAAMIECGNMRNADDLAVLGSPAGRQRIADALTTAVGSYLRRP